MTCLAANLAPIQGRQPTSLGRGKPWHDKQTHKTFIRPASGKCLYYYFYFMDAGPGLIYLQVAGEIRGIVPDNQQLC